MKARIAALPVFLAVCSAVGGFAQANAGFLHSDRLKILSLPDRPIIGSSRNRVVQGVWVPESSTPKKALVFPIQVSITCHNYSSDDRKCVELSVTLNPTKTLVGVGELDMTEYSIDRWDEQGLIASYGGNEDNLDSKCQRHVLTMDFASGAVSVSDIPTHMKGCEAFMTTNSYRLLRGAYYVDTTPNNDIDKPAEKPK